MTINGLAQQLIGEQGEKAGDTDYIAQLETWIKDAITKISLSTNFKFFWKDYQFDTVANTPLYSFPKDMRAIKFMRIVLDDEPIDIVNPKRLSEFGVDMEQKGTPKFFWLQDAAVSGSDFIQKVRLAPIPNGVKTIQGPYYFHPVDLITTSVIPVTDEGILTIKNWVRTRMHIYDKDFDQANYERSEFNENLKLLQIQDKVQPSQNLVAGQRDLPKRSKRPARLRYPFE